MQEDHSIARSSCQPPGVVLSSVPSAVLVPLANKGSFSVRSAVSLSPDQVLLLERRWMAYQGLRSARLLLRGYRDDQLRAEGLDPGRLEGRERGDHQMARCRWVRWSPEGYVVTYSPARQRGNIKGWVTCKSWLCPVCGAILAQERSTELGKAVQVARERGCVVALGRFSDRHRAGDEQTIDELAGWLRVQLDELRRDYHELKRGRVWRGIQERYGVLGPGRGGKMAFRLYSVGALEVTHGYNGYHPHEQPVFILRPGADVAQFEFEMRNLYYSVRGGAWVLDQVSGEIAPADRDAWENGCSVTSNDGEVNEYVTKFGRPPRWDVAQELVYWARKRGRFGKSKHYSMMELLWSYILAGRQDHGRLWVAFVLALKGKHHLDWSDGLRDWAGLGAARTDDQVIDDASDYLDELAVVDDLTMHLVLRHELRAELLSCADAGDPERVQAWLAALRSGGVVKSVPGPSGVALESVG